MVVQFGAQEQQPPPLSPLPPRRWIAGAVALGLFIGFLSGCSLATMNRVPDDWHPPASVDCTESKARPYADLVVGSAVATAGAFLLGAALIDGCDDTGFLADIDNQSCKKAKKSGAIMLAASLPFLYSSYVGFGRASRCDEAKTQLEVAQIRPQLRSATPALQ